MPKAKALHVGTYEAAVENMLRRMDDQSDAASQFYLHRVQLRTDCAIEPGIHKEPTDWMGDAHLEGKCGPGVNVLRYVNVHEDQSSVSLAIEISAVWRVQSIPIPLPVDADDPPERAQLVFGEGGILPWQTERLLAQAADGPAPEVTGDYRPGDVRHVVASPQAAPAGMPNRWRVHARSGSERWTRHDECSVSHPRRSLHASSGPTASVAA